MDDKFQPLEAHPLSGLRRTDVIYCADLVRLGYPAGYAKAEKALESEGFVYLIAYDAWVSPRGLEIYKATGKLPELTEE